MFVKDFKHLPHLSLKQLYSNPKGPTCFPDFHTIHGTAHILNLNSPHCILYLTSINVVTPFSFSIHHLFQMLLPDFLSIIHTYFHHPTFILKIFFLPNPLFGNSKQLMTIMTSINFLHCLSSFLIHSHIY